MTAQLHQGVGVKPPLTDRSRSGDLVLFGVAVCLLWLYGVGSAWLGLQVNGRGTLAIGVAPNNHAVNVLRTYTMLAVMGVTLMMIAKNWRQQLRVPIWNLMIYLGHFVILSLLVVAFDAQLGLGFAMFALFGGAVWLSDLRFEDAAIVGWLTIGTALLALGMGLFDPDQGLAIRGSGSRDSKAIIGSELLAGPFASPNTLGLIFALALPTVWLVRNSVARTSGTVLVCAALIWSASRSSIVAVVVAAACVVLCRRGLFKVAAALPVSALVIMVALPLTTVEGDDFTGRGRIWLGSLAAINGDPWFGDSPDFYQLLPLYRNSLGNTAFHGHNVFVQYMAIGGLVTTAALIGFLLWAVKISTQVAREGASAVPMACVAAFCVSGILESVYDTRSPAYLGWITWSVLALLALAAHRTRSVSDLADAK